MSCIWFRRMASWQVNLQWSLSRWGCHMYHMNHMFDHWKTIKTLHVPVASSRPGPRKRLHLMALSHSPPRPRSTDVHCAMCQPHRNTFVEAKWSKHVSNRFNISWISCNYPAWREQHPITCHDSQQNSELRHKAVGPLDGDCWTDCFSRWAPGRTADRTNQVPCGMWSTCGALGYEGSKDQIIYEACLWVSIAVASEMLALQSMSWTVLVATMLWRWRPCRHQHTTPWALTATPRSQHFAASTSTTGTPQGRANVSTCFNVYEILRYIELRKLHWITQRTCKGHAKCSDQVILLRVA